MLKVRRIGILVFPDVEELDFVGAYEVLAKTKHMWEEGSLNVDEPLSVEIIAKEREVKCKNGLLVKAHKSIEALDDYDMIIVPGGHGIFELKEDQAILSKLAKFAKEKPICSVCTGAFPLAWAGVLRGKTATTHWNYKQVLKDFCTVSDERVVVDGNVITSAGVSSSIDLGLRLLEMIYGKDVAAVVAKRIEYSAYKPD